MKILFFSAFFKAKGHETYLSDEIFTFAKNYPKSEFIIYTTNSEKNKITKLKKNILWIERKNLKNPVSILKLLKDMVLIFTKFKPDIIHSTYVIESLIMGIFGRIFRVPSILHGRGTDLNYYPFVSIRKNILARISCKINKKILTVSKAMKHDIIKLNIPANKIEYIYNGIDYELFKPKGSKNYLKIEELELIHIGRLSPEKCQDLIIEVLKDLKENNIKFHFSLIGFGHKILRDNKTGYEIKKNLRLLVKKYNLDSYVSFIGFVDHHKIPDYLERAHIYLQPSLTEGLPNSVLEAMSMELPIIMTKVGGMLELNLKSGVILIEKNSKIDLYNAILHYFNNPGLMEIGGKKNRKYILDNFTWNKHTKKLYEIYSQLIKK